MGNPLLPAPPKRCFMQTVPHRKRNTANEKDPSAALGMTIREYRLPARLSSRCESQPPPLRATSFHGKEGECRLTDSPYRWLSIRKYRFPAFVISSESETSFSFAVKKECERSGQWETLCSLHPEKTVFHADRSTQEREHGKRKRSLGCARDDDTRIPLPHT